MRLVILLLVAISLSLQALEIEYSDINSRRFELLEDGDIRITERVVAKNEKVIIKNIPVEIERDSLVYDINKVRDAVFYLEGDSSRLEGSKVEYEGEEYIISSMLPLIIERARDGKVVINPSKEIVIAPSRIKGNTLIINLEECITELSYSYKIDGLRWWNSYILDIDRDILETNLIIKSDLSSNIENISLETRGSMAPSSLGEGKDKLSLKKMTENNYKVGRSLEKLEKKYVYTSSSDKEHPQIAVELGREVRDIEVVVLEDNRYIGNDSLKKLVEDRSELREELIDMEREKGSLEIGLGITKESRSFKIKNYKKDAVKVKLIYDELPSRWSELRSKVDYILEGEKVVFEILIPGNSRREVEFFYIQEKV